METIFQVYLSEKVDLKDKIFLAGFRSHIGQTGYIATRHLVENEKSKRIGFIDTTYMPPSAFMGRKGILTPFELYLHDKFIIFFARSQPQRIEWNDLVRSLVRWLKNHNVAEAVLLGGLDNQFQPENEELRVAATTQYLQKKILDEKYKFIETDLGIYGPLALFLSYFEIFSIPALALLPYAESGRPDPRAAAVALSHLSKLYDVEFDIEPLIQDAEEIEREIQKILTQQQERADSERKGTNMYI